MRFGHRWMTLACLMLAAGSAQATPVAYDFATGPWSSLTGQIQGPAGIDVQNSLKDAVNGLSMSGSFMYDSDAPLSGISNGPVLNQSTYLDAVSNLNGSDGTFGFTGSTASASVANDGYPLGGPVHPLNYVDYLQLGGPASGTGTLAGLALTYAQFFWFEVDSHAPGATDFLTSSDLPATLPTFNSQLILSFSSIDATGHTVPAPAAFAIFYGVKVTPTPVPEPGTLALAALGMAVAIVMRRRRAA